MITGLKPGVNERQDSETLEPKHATYGEQNFGRSVFVDSQSARKLNSQKI
jgi:hypothetical protein